MGHSQNFTDTVWIVGALGQGLIVLALDTKKTVVATLSTLLFLFSFLQGEDDSKREKKKIRSKRLAGFLM